MVNASRVTTVAKFDRRGNDMPSLGLGLSIENRRPIVRPTIIFPVSTVLEGTSIGSVVTTMYVANSEDTWTFTETADADSKFTLGGTNNAQIRVGAALDHEAKGSHEYSVSATNGTDTITGSVTITVTDVDEGGGGPAYDASLVAPVISLTVDQDEYPPALSAIFDPSISTADYVRCEVATDEEFDDQVALSDPLLLVGTGSHDFGLSELTTEVKRWFRERIEQWVSGELVAYGPWSNVVSHGESQPAEIRVLSEGDSITATTSPASYSRLWAAEHPDIEYANYAVGGSGLGSPGDVPPTDSLYRRQAASLAYAPTHKTVQIGANDLPSDTTTYLNNLYAYIAPFRSAGTIVIVCTVLPRSATGWQAKMEAANTKLRADAGVHFDYLVDFATTEMGVWGAQLDPALYPDLLHPSAPGQAILKRPFATVLNWTLDIPNEPLDFAFAPATDASPDVDIEGPTYTVKGLFPGETRPYSAVGYVRKNGGSFVLNGSGTVVEGDEITPLVRSSADPAGEVEMSVTIGTTTAEFAVVTAGAGSAPWTPLNLGSKLAGWWRPEEIAGADGSDLIAWEDASGAEVTLTGTGVSSGLPLVDTLALNGMNVAQFDAAVQQGYMTFPSGYRSAVAARTSSATFYVAKKISDPDYTYYTGPIGGWGSNREEYYPFGNALIYSGYGRSTRLDAYGAGHPPLNAWHFGSYQSAASDWRHYLNGGLVHQDASNVVTMGSDPQVGRSETGIFNGSIAEIIDLNAAPTTLERQKLEGYLAWKFGLQASLPSDHPYKDAAPTV